jgi:hypothetical protein
MTQVRITPASPNVGGPFDSVAANGIFAVERDDGMHFDGDLVFALTDAASPPGSGFTWVITVPTGCGSSPGIRVKDTYGSLRVVAMSDGQSPVVSCAPAVFNAKVETIDVANVGTSGKARKSNGNAKSSGKSSELQARFTAAEVESITFQYLGLDLHGTASGAASLEKGDDWIVTEFAASPALADTAAVVVSSTVSAAVSRQLNVGDMFEVRPDSSLTFPEMTTFRIVASGSSAGQLVSMVKVRTECTDTGITVGDVFGSLRVVALATTMHQRAFDCDSGSEVNRMAASTKSVGKKAGRSKGSKVDKSSAETGSKGSKAFLRDDADTSSTAKSKKGKGKKGDGAGAASGGANRVASDASVPRSMTLQYVGPELDNACSNGQGIVNTRWGYTAPTPDNLPSPDAAKLLSSATHYVIDAVGGSFRRPLTIRLAWTSLVWLVLSRAWCFAGL